MASKKINTNNNVSNKVTELNSQRVVKKTPLVGGQKYLPASSSVVTGIRKV